MKFPVDPPVKTPYIVLSETERGHPKLNRVLLTRTIQQRGLLFQSKENISGRPHH